ncbi:hypothetical protein VII00023_05062 [Vibrio ichthyoenteri ATCC 700023]|uniref:Uncharacterized protein n=1 Tax=Vibrio ichthyoenteri ATCC 700023 TaxID=870968 RepID=F9S6I5_9VIBR|nr:hypothetical protein VII00023_05062 [Vibrio ichthyoenteri ATCC 700023]
MRVIDGASFYDLATGRRDALKELHEVLPRVIEKVYQEELEDDTFTVNDIPNYAQYFELAYGD